MTKSPKNGMISSRAAKEAASIPEITNNNVSQITASTARIKLLQRLADANGALNVTNWPRADMQEVWAADRDEHTAACFGGDIILTDKGRSALAQAGIK